MFLTRKRIIVLCATLALIITAAFLLKGPRFWHEPAQNINSVAAEAIDYSSHTLRQNQYTDLYSLEAYPVAGITSHHLPTAENFIGSFYASLSKARPHIKHFLVVGPDHFEQCRGLASLTTKDFLTPFGTVENYTDMALMLKAEGVGEDSECFINEHSIGVQMAYIKKFFPNAGAAAMIFSSAASASTALNLAKKASVFDSEVFVVASIDFSHYQNVIKANAIDSTTETQINKLSGENSQLSQMDSPGSFNFVLSFAKALKTSPLLLIHANSYEFTGVPDNTTGYFNVIFSKGKNVLE
jgi:AmmeMemoRadiSam system protein B